MAVVNITNDNFQSEVIDSDKKVLVDFWASWCGPCKMIAPVVESIAEEHPEIKVAKINVDEQGDLAARYQIMSIPTILVFENGEVVNQSVGFVAKQELEQIIK